MPAVDAWCLIASSRRDAAPLRRPVRHRYFARWPASGVWRELLPSPLLPSTGLRLCVLRGSGSLCGTGPLLCGTRALLCGAGRLCGPLLCGPRLAVRHRPAARKRLPSSLRHLHSRCCAPWPCKTLLCGSGGLCGPRVRLLCGSRALLCGSRCLAVRLPAPCLCGSRRLLCGPGRAAAMRCCHQRHCHHTGPAASPRFPCCSASGACTPAAAATNE